MKIKKNIKTSRIFTNLNKPNTNRFLLIDLSKIKSRRVYVGDENIEEFRRLYGK